jgi:hypothetical protein
MLLSQQHRRKSIIISQEHHRHFGRKSKFATSGRRARRDSNPRPSSGGRSGRLELTAHHRPLLAASPAWPRMKLAGDSESIAACCPEGRGSPQSKSSMHNGHCGKITRRWHRPVSIPTDHRQSRWQAQSVLCAVIMGMQPRGRKSCRSPITCTSNQTADVSSRRIIKNILNRDQ